MQNLMKISFASLLIILMFVSCTKHNSERGTSAYYFSASSSSIGSFSSSGSSLLAGGAGGAKIEIEATSSTGAQMVLWLDPFPGTTGVYSIDSTHNGIEYASASFGSIVESAHGSITLTVVTPDIIGSFTYTGRDSVVYTGSFDVAAP